MKYRGSYEFPKKQDERRQKSGNGEMAVGEIRWRSRAVKEQLRGEREETSAWTISSGGRIDYCSSSTSGRGSQYRYYSVAGILGYNAVYGHTEIYGVIHVIVGM